jgi:hypothetical protein
MALLELLESGINVVLGRPLLASALAVLALGGIYLRHISDVLIVAARWTRFATLAVLVVGALLVAGIWTDAIDLNQSMLRQVLDLLPVAASAALPAVGGPAYDADERELRVSIPRGWLVVVSVASLAGAVTTVIALSAAPDRLAESVAFTRLVIGEVGLVRGMALVAGLKVLAVVAVAQLAVALPRPFVERGHLWDWVPRAAAIAVYGGASAWYGWLAVHNIVVLTGGI